VLNVPGEYHMAEQNAAIRRVSDPEILVVIDLRLKASPSGSRLLSLP
jgi:hypothetical protein